MRHPIHEIWRDTYFDVIEEWLQRHRKGHLEIRKNKNSVFKKNQWLNAKESNTGKRARRKNLRHPRERFLVSNEAPPIWRPIEIFSADVWDFFRLALLSVFDLFEQKRICARLLLEIQLSRGEVWVGILLISLTPPYFLCLSLDGQDHLLQSFQSSISSGKRWLFLCILLT
jgi:hypothetical protein